MFAFILAALLCAAYAHPQAPAERVGWADANGTVSISVPEVIVCGAAAFEVAFAGSSCVDVGVRMPTLKHANHTTPLCDGGVARFSVNSDFPIVLEYLGVDATAQGLTSLRWSPTGDAACGSSVTIENRTTLTNVPACNGTIISVRSDGSRTFSVDTSRRDVVATAVRAYPWSNFTLVSMFVTKLDVLRILGGGPFTVTYANPMRCEGANGETRRLYPDALSNAGAEGPVHGAAVHPPFSFSLKKPPAGGPPQASGRRPPYPRF